MKAFILIAVILTFTAYFSPGESLEDLFKPLKQFRPQLLPRLAAKSGQVLGRLGPLFGRHKVPRGHQLLPHPHRPQVPHGPSPRPTSPPENIVHPTSQALSAPSSAPPTVIHTTAANAATTAANAAATTAANAADTTAPNAAATTAAAAAPTTASPASAQNTAGAVPSTTASSAQQPENITSAPAAGTTPAPAADTTAVNQQQEQQ
ncbi:integumentary mucin C.1-like isoform X3 [Mustela erminea]|uniref:integumentary mucin C.1-like isoform X2 n=1 Tax=Mustela erminea TaxID=36723 RepID=UPI0013873CC0|nr:integumentary mucin C.1-like isoform X2 [Mustela erminea]XP_032190391.1 integumentary mucin C.1-like isoform X3 [Mustela erminea]